MEGQTAKVKLTATMDDYPEITKDYYADVRLLPCTITRLVGF